MSGYEGAISCATWRHRRLQDALHLGAGVDAGIVGGVAVVLPALLAEVHAAGEFADAQEIGAVHEFRLQRGLVHQGLEGLHRAEVRIQAQLLADGQQALFRADLGGRVIVIFGVADGSEEDGVAVHAEGVRLGGIGIPELVDGAGAYVSVRVGHLVPEAGAHGIDSLDGLLHHFRSDAVAGEFRNLEFHIRLFSMRFNILTVALMAASVWSESTPRVLNPRPPMSQEIEVSTRASVLPPGGILTT